MPLLPRMKKSKVLAALEATAFLVAGLQWAGCRTSEVARWQKLRPPAESWSPPSRKLLTEPGEHRVQLLISEVVATAGRAPVLRRHGYRVDAEYFYPASSIKLGAAVLALQKLADLSRERGDAELLHAPMEIGSLFAGDPPQRGDPADEAHPESGATLPISVGRELRKLALVSDNQAFNRLFEFVGHETLNRGLHSLGLASVVINHRLSDARPIADQRVTAEVILRPTGLAPVEVPPRVSSLALTNRGPGLQIGRGYVRGGTVVPTPMDFTSRNGISLVDLQDLLVKVARPDVALGGPALTLTDQHRAALLEAMTQYPAESADPKYPLAEFPDAYSKFLLPGVRRVFPSRVPGERVEITGKIGRAYGFSVENAYLRNPANGRAVFVTAVVYTNADGILNDDQYEYAELADPFLADLGEWVARRWLSPPR